MARIRIKNKKGYEKDKNLVNTFSKDLKHFKPCFRGVTPTVVFAKVKKNHNESYINYNRIIEFQ